MTMLARNEKLRLTGLSLGDLLSRMVRHLTAVLVVLLCADARALQFEVKQISDSSTVSRDPTIGSASLIAWISAYTNDLASGSTRLTMWNGGQRSELDNPQGGRQSFKPQSISNALVWVGSYSNILGDLQILREVPWRDEGGAVELRALYTAIEVSNGTPAFIPVPTNEQYMVVMRTNEQGGVFSENVRVPVDITNEVRRHPSGTSEILYWNTGEVQRVTHDHRHDFAPSVGEGQIAWQKEKGWPFGWEVFYWRNGAAKQLTTNFYYDMAPKIQGEQVVWYGWDGHDFEIFLYDNTRGQTLQITSNRYDDIAPVLWGGEIAWEGYSSAEADIFLYHNLSDTNGNPILTNGAALRGPEKISQNTEDDINPRIWDGRVVWQGFDGDDFEIYYFDGKKTFKLTANNYDDINPDICDGLVVWQGYKDNWDAEIFAWDIGEGFTKDANGNTIAKGIVQITENDEEDRDVRTASRRVVWQQDEGGKSRIMLGTPK